MRYKSETFSLATGGDTKTIGQGGAIAFLPEFGPRKRRNVISRIIFKQSLSITTGAGVTAQTANLANMCKRLRIWDAQGDMVNLTGPSVRAWHIHECGRDAVSDAADLAANTATQLRTVYHVVDFAPRFRARDRWDFGLAVGTLLKGGGIEFTAGTGTDIGTGGTPTIVSDSLVVYVECREETDAKKHVRREIREAVQTATGDLYLPVNGGLVRSAFLFKSADHDTGGTAQDATAVTIEAFGYQRIEPDILQQNFMLEGNCDRASTQDPFVQSTPRALPLIFPKRDEKLNEMHTADGQVLVRLDGSTVTNNVIVYELITKETDLSTIATRALVGGSFIESVKTKGKTKRDPKAWRGLAPFMPKKYRRVG